MKKIDKSEVPSFNRASTTIKLSSWCKNGMLINLYISCSVWSCCLQQAPHFSVDSLLFNSSIRTTFLPPSPPAGLNTRILDIQECSAVLRQHWSMQLIFSHEFFLYSALTFQYLANTSRRIFFIVCTGNPTRLPAKTNKWEANSSQEYHTQVLQKRE